MNKNNELNSDAELDTSSFDDAFFDSAFFDDASKRWRENKIQKKNGTFIYRCCHKKTDNERCKLPITYGNKKKYNINNIFCRVHLKRKFDDITTSFV